MKAKTFAALKFAVMLLAVLFAAATLASVIAGTTERVSISTEGYETNPWSSCSDASISPDGRYVAFDSIASNLFPGAPPDGTETNRTPNIFIRDLGTDDVLPSTIRVTYAVDGGDPDGYCASPSISENGLSVVFNSRATNLVPGDTNAAADVFVWDRDPGDPETGTITRVSVGPGGGQGNGGSGVGNFAISADGKCIAFGSSATNLIVGGTDGTSNVYVRDRTDPDPDKHTTILVSVGPDGKPANGDSSWPAISADGKRVAFVSDATNLVAGDTNGASDVFVRDLEAGVTRRVSVASDGTQANDLSRWQPALSADGRFVAFSCAANNLVKSSSNKRLPFRIYVYDWETGKTTLVSVSSDGTPSSLLSWFPAINANGRFVAFTSGSDNLVPGDTNRCYDIFVHDRLSRETTRVSVATDGTQANRTSDGPSISADGRLVAFYSFALNLVENDNSDINGDADIFVHDRGEPGPWTIPTQSLSDAVVGQPYSVALRATGGTALPIWGLSSGSLPAGLKLDSETGDISGTPTAQGTTTFRVELFEDAAETPLAVSGDLSIKVAPATKGKPGRP